METFPTAVMIAAGTSSAQDGANPSCSPGLYILRKDSAARWKPRTFHAAEKLCCEVEAPDFTCCGKTLLRGGSPGLYILRKNSAARWKPRTSVRGSGLLGPRKHSGISNGGFTSCGKTLVRV